MPTAVYLETGKQKVFACALDWPGWCRSGRDEAAALEAFADYAARYAPVARRAGLSLPANAGKKIEVVERVAGSGATDFGIPDKVASRDAEPMSKKQADRQTRLVEAAWEVFDDVVAGAPPTLRKGPRGGGRDRDPIVDHVVGAEASYARMLGLKLKPPAAGDADAIRANRVAMAEVLRAGQEPGRRWPLRYAFRRIAWHVLDHAWEIEDKSEPQPSSAPAS
jgi:hypothetical protein